jgi:hypothetical protein
MDDEAPKTIKLRAEDNAWFLLATLYGRPAPDDRELQSKIAKLGTGTWLTPFPAILGKSWLAEESTLPKN